MGILVAISKQEIEKRYFFEEYLAKQFAQCWTSCRARQGSAKQGRAR